MCGRRQRHGLKFAHRHRPAEQVALVGVAALAGQKIPLCLGLHALGNHRQFQAGAQRHHHAGNGCIVGVLQHVAHKALVDLELVQWQALEVRER